MWWRKGRSYVALHGRGTRQPRGFIIVSSQPHRLPHVTKPWCPVFLCLSFHTAILPSWIECHFRTICFVLEPEITFSNGLGRLLQDNLTLTLQRQKHACEIIAGKSMVKK